MKIRHMVIDDYSEVYRLWQNVSGMGVNNTDDSIEGIGKFLARNPKSCFVAEIGDSIHGTIMCGHDGRRGHIYHMAVAKSLQRRGIATALLEHALAALNEEGITKAALVVFSDNHAGNTFWDKRGFTIRNDLVYRDKETGRPE